MEMAIPQRDYLRAKITATGKLPLVFALHLKINRQCRIVGIRPKPFGGVRKVRAENQRQSEKCGNRFHFLSGQKVRLHTGAFREK